ncbi:MAG: helix-turn-helix domain-containing protein [Rhodospirillales bacterium]
MHNRNLDYLMPMISPRQNKESYLVEFDAAWAGGGFWMSIWPPMLWRPSRAMVLKEMIVYMLGMGGVWFATMGEINDHNSACIVSGTWSSRVDVLPFDHSPINELSKVFGVSLRQLERLFQSQLSDTVNGYYRRLRLEKARSMSQATCLSVTEIVVACGFVSISHFSQRFKYQFGKRPSDVRSTHIYMPQVSLTG